MPAPGSARSASTFTSESPPPPYSVPTSDRGGSHRTYHATGGTPWDSDDISSSERSSLLHTPSDKKRNVHFYIICLPAILVVLLMCGAYVAGLYTLLPADDPEFLERKRLEYRTDRELWDADKEVWRRERAEYTRLSEMYNRDQMTWQAERWHMDAERAAFHAELALQDEERKSWAAEREEYGQEKKQWDVQRRLWEREERLHPGRCPVVPAGAYWDPPKPSPTCLSYGKREYSARLWNIPTSWHWIDACNGTPINIHGVSIRSPDYCEDLGTWGGLIGHWIVDFGEDYCESAIDEFHDAGRLSLGSELGRVEVEVRDNQSEGLASLVQHSPSND